MKKRCKVDTVLLIAALFLTSGAVLAYNILTSDVHITVSLSDLVENDSVPVSLISDAAAGNLQNDSILVNTEPADTPVGATLPPIVTPLPQ